MSVTVPFRGRHVSATSWFLLWQCWGLVAGWVLALVYLVVVCW